MSARGRHSEADRPSVIRIGNMGMKRYSWSYDYRHSTWTISPRVSHLPQPRPTRIADVTLSGGGARGLLFFSNDETENTYAQPSDGTEPLKVEIVNCTFR
jgi:hypothetical protein